MKILKRIFGCFTFALGLCIAAWIGYNLIIERLPATQGRNLIPGMFTALAFLFVGFKWMAGK